ncbi:MAG: response regulator, partial [Sedimentisphaerales bacterium]|nr:response regulator [Sedimentisphaerales bacterium]
MAKEAILIVDDEEDIIELVKYNLTREGYQVICAATGEDAIAKAKRKLPDLIVLDLMLPDIDGFEVCKLLRNDSKTAHIPIIMLTAKGEEADVVSGLEVGADDYIAKPFSPKVLTARVRTVLRRKAKTSNDIQTIKIHELVIDPTRHEVLVAGKAVTVSFTEFAILQCLAKRPGIVFSRYQIVDAIRGSDYPVTDRSVDVQIVSLRKKLGAAGKYIQ